MASLVSATNSGGENICVVYLSFILDLERERLISSDDEGSEEDDPCVSMGWMTKDRISPYLEQNWMHEQDNGKQME